MITRAIIAVVLASTLTACSEGNPQGGEQVSEQREAPAATPRPDTSKVVLFLGTSLTAGLGVGVDQAYPAVVQSLIDSAGLPYRVSNAGISGETSAGGVRRLDWLLQSPLDVLVLELGANDGLRGLSVERMRSNLDSIISLTRKRYPGSGLVILGMQAPPNLGDRYTSEFRGVYRELAAKHDAALVPFLLDGVAAVDSLNQEDGIHPNAAGHRLIARNVWRGLGPLLRARAQRTSGDSL